MSEQRRAGGAPVGGNGTCGRIHGEVVGQLAAHASTLARLEDHTQRQWSAIGERIRWRMFAWVLGALLGLAGLGAGSFAYSQREALADHRESISKIEGQCQRTNERWDVIRDQLTEITVHLERLDTTLQHHQADHARERDRHGK